MTTVSQTYRHGRSGRNPLRTVWRETYEVGVGKAYFKITGKW